MATCPLISGLTKVSAVLLSRMVLYSLHCFYFSGAVWVGLSRVVWWALPYMIREIQGEGVRCTYEEIS